MSFLLPPPQAGEVKTREALLSRLQIALERPTVPLEHAAVAPVAEPFVAGAEKDKSLTN